jgi:hypothetical protein
MSMRRDAMHTTFGVLQETKLEIEKQKCIENSLEDTLARLVNQTQMIFDMDMLHQAWMQQSKKAKKERVAYDLVKERFIKHFIDPELIEYIEDLHITPEGYESYLYQFTFELFGNKFVIEIPTAGVITKKNLRLCHYGKFSVGYEERKGVWHFFKSSYDREDITKAMNDFLKEREICK